MKLPVAVLEALGCIMDSAAAYEALGCIMRPSQQRLLRMTNKAQLHQVALLAGWQIKS
jgi:hypothetical protein